MTDAPSVVQLFPAPTRSVPLRGLYLDDSLRPTGTAARPFVYASFAASLDGRISLPDPKTGARAPPPAITNPRDWRLVQELAASADVIVTSGRYIRDLAAGHAQADVPVSTDAAFADLLAWRAAHGLARQPAVAIVTRNSALSIPDALLASGRPIYLVTAAGGGELASALRVRGVRLLRCGENAVDGRALLAALAHEGFGNVDMTAGGALLGTLLATNALDRLYLTHACRLLGGQSFDTMVKGPVLDPPIDLTPRALFYDAADGHRAAQLFSVLDRRTSSRACQR